MAKNTTSSDLNDGKKEALEAARLQIDKEFGKGSLMKLGIGRDILLLPIPAFSMAILSLLALSMERKYVVPNKKAKDETIIKYWGTDNSAY